MIMNNRSRDASIGHRVLQAHSHGILGRANHRHQCDQLHIPMAERLTLGKFAEPNAEDHQNLAPADLDRVVNQPYPVW